MKLQHHLGGLANLGAVNLDTRVFAQPWERRIFGIHTVMMAESAHLADALPRYPLADLPTAFRDTWTWASLRTGAEAMQPFEYFKYRYYEKWLMGISQFFIDRGYLSADELAERTAAYRTAPEAALPSTPAPALNEQIRAYLRQGDSGRQPRANAARFVAGDAVRVADPEAVDHTRLPGYLRNRAGIVDHVYPDAWSYFVDTGADGIGAPMPVYRIVCRGEDVWGPRQGEPNTRLYADLYEAYLVAAN